MSHLARGLGGPPCWLLLGILAWSVPPSMARAEDGQPILRISGPAASAPVELTLEQVEAVGTATMTTSTPWNREPARFEGVLVSALVDRFAPAAEMLEMTALNDYKVVLDVSDLRKYRAMLVSRIDGKPMRVRDKGPLWLVYPYDEYAEVRTAEYVARMIWQLKEIVAK